MTPSKHLSSGHRGRKIAGYGLAIFMVSLGSFVFLPRDATVSAAKERAVKSAGSWEVLPSMKYPRQELAAAGWDGKIYALGGMYALKRPPWSANSNFAEVYDVASRKWKTLPPLPETVHHPSAAAVDGKIYLMGGYTGHHGQSTDHVWEYDPARNSWAAKAPLPTGRGALAAVELGGLIYAVGGMGGLIGTEAARSVTDFAVYDPKSDTWRSLPPMHHARNHLAATAINGRIYVTGGRITDLDMTEGFTLRHVEEYDPKTETWKERAPMNRGRSGHGAGSVGGKLYVFGGESHAPVGIIESVEGYDPATDIWTFLPDMPKPRHGIYGVSMGGKIYLPGGGPPPVWVPSMGIGKPGIVTGVNYVDVFKPGK